MFNRDADSWIFIDIRQPLILFSNPIPTAFDICCNNYRNQSLTIFDDPYDVDNYINGMQSHDSPNLLLLSLMSEMEVVLDILNTRNYNDFYDSIDQVIYYSLFSPPRYIPFLENNDEYVASRPVSEEQSELSFDALPEHLFEDFCVAPPVEENLRKGKYEDSVELETYDLDDIEEFSCVKVGNVYQIYKPEVLVNHIIEAGAKGRDLQEGQFRDINTNTPVYIDDVYTVSSDFLRKKYPSEENAPQADEPAVRKHLR